MALMREMVAAGEADELVPERVWQETRSALAEDRPDVFVQTLRDCGALARIYPELDRLFGVPQPPKWHPERDCGVHLLLCLAQAAKLSEEPRVRFAVMLHDVGKGTTPASILPSHRGHEERGVELIRALARRIRVPKDYRDLALLVARHHGHCHRAMVLDPEQVFELLNALDAFRRPERFAEFLLACEADLRGRTGFEKRPYPQAERLRAAHAAAAAVRPRTGGGLPGVEIGERLRAERLAAVAAALSG
jgi:tRNA nucleotidyltransferase (CCA-adding enzyme)